MDKKNTLIGVALLIAAFAIMYFQGQDINYQEIKEETEHVSEATQPSPQEPKSTAASAEPTSFFQPVAPATAAVMSAEAPLSEDFYELENDFIRARFTTRGGAIKDVVLKKYPAHLNSNEPFVFNAVGAEPALEITFDVGAGVHKAFTPTYTVASQSADKILFTTQTPEGVQVYRGYSISLDETKRDSYVIAHETKFINKSASAFNLKEFYLNLGTLPPTKGDAIGEYLNIGYYNGKKAFFIKASEFNASSGFLGFGKRKASEEIAEYAKPLVWASVKNQFFASVLTPNEPAIGIYSRPTLLPSKESKTGFEEAISGNLIMDLGLIQSGEERIFGLKYYVGPKEYQRLEALGQDQDTIMQFGFFGFFSKILLIIMTAIHGFIPNWGLTIIAVTVVIKLILWPLTNMQVRSSKRMAKIQGPMKELKEKYKNNPQKLQMETMKLFKEHKVNPAAGCLPLFVQLPIFLGLYFMLRTSSELRFAEFLWIPDLSLPDTIAFLGGFPVNILPLLMSITMFFQMKFTPTPMTDGFQAKIFQFMPFIFLVFCYNFPSGLVLYWTAQNLLTIFQQWLTNRSDDPADLVPVATEGSTLKTKTKKKTSNKK